MFDQQPKGGVWRFFASLKFMPNDDEVIEFGIRTYAHSWASIGRASIDNEISLKLNGFSRVEIEISPQIKKHTDCEKRKLIVLK